MNPGTEPASQATPPSRSRKVFLISGLAAVLVAAVVLVLMLAHHQVHQTSTTKRPSPPATVAVVQITHTGFMPNTLSVSPNTKIVWVNEDTMPHLPAADPYPTHAELPYLVAPRALGQNETYNFLFTKKATVHYHDDLNPTLTGTIEVR